MSIQKFFYQTPVFTYAEFAAFLTSQGTRNPNAQHASLKYYLQKKRLIHIRRGIYAVVPPFIEVENFTPDPYLIAAKLFSNVILAYHTALELHGVAYSLFKQFTFFTSKSTPPFIFDSFIFRGILTPKNIRHVHKEIGIIFIKRDGISIPVTTVARTIVDILTRPDLAGGWEEIWRSLEMIAVFDIEEAVKYALLLNNASTIAKLGFFLEQRTTVLNIDPKYIKILEKHIPSQPHYLERGRRQSGKLIAKWNLIVPEQILKKSWEEPYENI